MGSTSAELTAEAAEPSRNSDNVSVHFSQSNKKELNAPGFNFSHNECGKLFTPVWSNSIRPIPGCPSPGRGWPPLLVRFSKISFWDEILWKGRAEKFTHSEGVITSWDHLNGLLAEKLSVTGVHRNPRGRYWGKKKVLGINTPKIKTNETVYD